MGAWVPVGLCLIAPPALPSLGNFPTPDPAETIPLNVFEPPESSFTMVANWHLHWKRKGFSGMFALGDIDVHRFLPDRSRYAIILLVVFIEL